MSLHNLQYWSAVSTRHTIVTSKHSLDHRTMDSGVDWHPLCLYDVHAVLDTYTDMDVSNWWLVFTVN
eukprot:5730-Heterococcus_DN1.PRE.7